MKIDLKKYYEERERLSKKTAFDGPVITFSREYGCEANRIVRMLISKINERNALLKKSPWKFINKEILEESAKDLGLHPSQIDQRIQSHDDGSLSTLFSSLGQHYELADRKIIEKVKDIILNYARKGNVVIVGRGGSIVTRDIENAIRVRLVAPLEWRAKVIADKMKVTPKEALLIIKKFDENRIKWMEHLANKSFDISVFDLIINVKHVSDDEILAVLLNLMETRGYIAPTSQVLKSELLKF